MAAMKPEELALEAVTEYKFLSGNRGTWEMHWEEIAQRIWPSYSNSFISHGQYRQPGAKRTDLVFDSTAALGLNRFAAILDSLLTPRNQTWHRLQATNPEINKSRKVRLWFDEVTRILFQFRYAPNANFAAQNQQNYKSLGSWGTGCLFTDELFGGKGMRYRAIHLGEIYFVENHQGMVDKALRFFPLTARQAIKQFGADKLPDVIKSAGEASPDRLFYFLHRVAANENIDPTRKDHRGMAFSSRYIAMDGPVLLREEGYNTFPYAISRYEQSVGEVYGRSPAMDVLPAIKTLNEQKKTMLKAGHRMVDPVLLAHDDGIVDTFSLKPGAINAGGVTADGRPLVHALPVGNPQVGKEMMDDERALINDAFLISLFQVLTETPQMTATEVMERMREKGILLAPTIGRQQSEYLGPMIEREIDVLARQQLLPPMPHELREARGQFKIIYDSPLSRAQRAEEAAGLMRSIESALQVVQNTQNPEPLDFFDWDQIMPEVAHINGVPERWMKSIDQVKIVRQGRQQQQQMQQAVQAGPAAAAMMKAKNDMDKGAAGT